MKKTLRIHFLNILEKDTDSIASSVLIKKLFKTIEAIPLRKDSNQSRVLTLADNVYYLLTSTDDKSVPTYPNCITGIFVKDRHFNYPYESNTLCELSKLTLKKDSNTIAEMTYFLIDLDLSILLWVSNRYVAGFSRFDSYINTICRFGTDETQEIELMSLLRKDAYDQLQKSDLIKKLVFKASTTIDKLITNEDGDILRKVDMLDDLPSDSVVKNIEVSISFIGETSEKQRKSIKAYILNMVSNKQLDKAHAKVVIDDKLDDIDFFNDQLMVTEQVSLSGKYTDYQIIFDMLHSHLESKKALISKEYRQ
jgi:hypothetical protein